MWYNPQSAQTKKANQHPKPVAFSYRHLNNVATAVIAQDERKSLEMSARICILYDLYWNQSRF